MRAALRAAIVWSLLACVADGAPARMPSPLALSCQGCHQPRVNAPQMPSLRHFPAATIAAALRSARDHPEPGSVMARLVARMSDEDIERLSAELAAR